RHVRRDLVGHDDDRGLARIGSGSGVWRGLVAVIAARGGGDRKQTEDRSSSHSQRLLVERNHSRLYSTLPSTVTPTWLRTTRWSSRLLAASLSRRLRGNGWDTVRSRRWNGSS